MTWLLLSIISMVAIGLISFINKVFAERKYDQLLSAMILYGLTFCLAFLYFWYEGFSYTIDYQLILLSSTFGIQMYIYTLILMTVLRYLPTSTYFISVRLGSSLILLSVGILFFGDVITIKESFGMVLGIAAMSLLFEKSNIQKINYKKGIGYFFLGLSVLAFGHIVTKLLADYNSYVSFILLIAYLSAFSTSIILGYRNIGKNTGSLKSMFSINMVQALLNMIYLILLFKVYSMGDLGISYKIQSYSPFIPIILSMIIYKEKINRIKIIAMIFSIMSLYFFM